MHHRLLRACRQFLRDDSGPTAVEYAIMLALIVVVCIGAVTSLGGSVSGTFNTVASIFSGGAAASSAGTGDSSNGNVASFDAGGFTVGGTGGNSQVGSYFDPGTAVSSGTYTVPWGTNQNASYNATTGVLTITSPDGSSQSSQQTAGKLPNIAQGYSWQQQN